MKTILNISIFLLTITLFAQKSTVSDQNPNYEISYQEALKTSDKYIIQQGSTANQTYVAIDPVEEKRVRKNIRKEYRAKKALWKHEERLARAKNTKSYRYSSNPGLYSGLGYGNLGIGISNGFNFRNSRLGCSYYIR